jgi:hypothetical protein
MGSYRPNLKAKIEKVATGVTIIRNTFIIPIE